MLLSKPLGGFTLVELLIVFSLLGLSMSLVVPLGLKQLDKVELKGDTKTLISFVGAVKKYAFWSNAKQKLHFQGHTLTLSQEMNVVKKITFNQLSFNDSIMYILPNGTVKSCINDPEFEFIFQALNQPQVCNFEENSGV